MRVGIATDHGGFGLKEELVTQLRAAGHEVIDFGAHHASPDNDYPDFVGPLARAVAAGTVGGDSTWLPAGGFGPLFCLENGPRKPSGVTTERWTAA
jgi:ribose 5-phosphate isomerase B